MPTAQSFAELVTQAAAEPVEGWDFSWLAGRATCSRRYLIEAGG